MSKFTLSTYLMLSVVFILSGIAWVIFTQTDSRFDLSGEFSSLNAEQDEILRQYYQLQDKYLPKDKQAEPVHKILSTQLASAPVQAVNNGPMEEQFNTTSSSDVWNNDRSAELESSEFLRNNPWSPDYQPGY